MGEGLIAEIHEQPVKRQQKGPAEMRGLFCVQNLAAGKKAHPAPRQNQPSSGRKGDRLRWKEPAGDFVAIAIM